MSACVGSAASMAGWRRSGEVVHTSTHAGAPLPAAAALAVLDELDAKGLAARAGAVGREAIARLAERARGHAAVRAVRGAGLMIGVEHASGRIGLAVMQALLERGFLVTTGGREGEVVVLTPPLTVAEAQLDAFGDAIERIWTARA
jgi:4-aminobutyrate aminotransferase-like enzyme